jgi:hypothetical protein
MVVVIGAILLIGLLAMWIDAHLLGRPVSMAFLPNGHSILPSLLLMGVAVVLAYYLPHRFRSEFNNRGLLSYRTGAQEPAKAWSLRRWVPPFKEGAEPRFDAAVAKWVDKEVNAHLQLGAKEARWSAGLALILVLLEMWAGLPIPFGFSYAFLLVFEFFLWWIIIAGAWTMGEVAPSPEKLEGYLSMVADCEQEAPGAASSGSGAMEASQGPRFGLRHLDLVSAGRMGTIFIESITYLLAVFGLLLVARLPVFGMARWRWGFSVFLLGVIPLGAIFATVALVFILGFWLQCYSTLQGLIRGIKRDRLEELEDLRFKALEGKSIKEQEEASALFEAQRRSIEQVSEQPWEPSESRQAWIALLLALLPPVLTSVIGQWSGPLMQFTRSLLG